jgi:hypothetical protein
MPNDVLRGIDAVLVLGVEDTSTAEGERPALMSQYDLSNVVGRLTSVSINITSDVRPFYEIGRRYPTHLRPGVVRVSGLGRARPRQRRAAAAARRGAVSRPPARASCSPRST